MMMTMAIVYGTQDTAASTNAATGDAATASAAIETAASAATMMAMMIVDKHATWAANGNGATSTNTNTTTATAAARVIGRGSVVTATRAATQRATARAVMAQAAHVTGMAHYQHATHNGATTALTGIRAGVMARADGTCRSWPA